MFAATQPSPWRTGKFFWMLSVSKAYSAILMKCLLSSSVPVFVIIASWIACCYLPGLGFHIVFQTSLTYVSSLRPLTAVFANCFCSSLWKYGSKRGVYSVSWKTASLECPIGQGLEPGSLLPNPRCLWIRYCPSVQCDSWWKLWFICSCQKIF